MIVELVKLMWCTSGLVIIFVLIMFVFFGVCVMMLSTFVGSLVFLNSLF